MDLAIAESGSCSRSFWSLLFLLVCDANAKLTVFDTTGLTVIYKIRTRICFCL